MSHTIQWDNDDKTVLLQRYHEGATKEDLYQLALKTTRMLSTCEHTVHLIIDERQINLVLNAADMTYLEQHVAHNQGAVVVIARPESIRFNTIRQQIGQRVAPTAFSDQPIFSCLEEARYYLERKFGVRYLNRIAE